VRKGKTMKLTDKVIVVTGGGNGIGREVVLALLTRGARVAAVDLRPEGLAETSALASAGERLTTHEVDVTSVEAVAALARDVVDAHGRVDGLVNVAGIIQPFVPFRDLDRAQIEKVMAVNFWGVVATCQEFLPLLLARPEAALVNVSSMGAFVPVPGQTIYGASKAAVKLLTEGLYAELKDTGVRVTAVYPGGVATHITENSGVQMPGNPDLADSKAATSMTSPQDAAEQLVVGMEKGSYRVVIGKDARMVDRLSRLAPQRATDLIAAKMKALLG
jgi:NAD(P)-dependent dehydrogenase (short-subunit alcohol dehydrogenase family)